jgi:hypothetical protein
VKDPALIFLAFLLPLAVYILVLGMINRRQHPFLVSGVWDFLGILVAASGPLLFGGPAVLSSQSERWRTFWLLGRWGGEGPEGLRQLWVILAALYFVVVVGGASIILWRQRRLTSIYNASEEMVEQALSRVCERLGASPVRSGNLFLFGLSPQLFPGQARMNGEGIQAPHYLPPSAHVTEEAAVLADKVKLEAARSASELLGHPAVLEIDAFPTMQHVTLRWDPAETPLRREIEEGLTRELERTPAPEHDLGAWLMILGLLLLGLALLGGLVVLLLGTHLV